MIELCLCRMLHCCFVNTLNKLLWSILDLCNSLDEYLIFRYQVFIKRSKGFENSKLKQYSSNHIV